MKVVMGRKFTVTFTPETDTEQDTIRDLIENHELVRIGSMGYTDKYSDLFYQFERKETKEMK